MKALVLKAYNEFAYTDVPDPQFGPEDVLIRVRACHPSCLMTRGPATN